jgi:hypothetical protein
MLILEMSDWHFKLYCHFWHKKVGDSAIVCARIWHGGLDVYEDVSSTYNVHCYEMRKSASTERNVCTKIIQKMLILDMS